MCYQNYLSFDNQGKDPNLTVSERRYCKTEVGYMGNSLILLESKLKFMNPESHCKAIKIRTVIVEKNMSQKKKTKKQKKTPKNNKYHQHTFNNF